MTLSDTLRKFVCACRAPVFLEEGEEALALASESYLIDERNGRVTFQVWDERHNVVRRVMGIERELPGRLEISIQRFGGRTGTVTLYDATRAANRTTGRQGNRRSFREQFRRFLRRQFTGWTLAELSTEADLENSLSPQYSRAFLRKGQEGWAAMGAPPESDVGGSLTFGLIWLDYLRRREPGLAIHGLVMYVPDGEQNPICLRARWLDAKALRISIFAYSPEGCEEAIDASDYGNLETRLEQCTSLPRGLNGEAAGWVERLTRNKEVERIRKPNGEWSLRVRGLEFASTSEGRLLFGIDHKTPAGAADLNEIEAMARELERLRRATAEDSSNPLYTRHRELWLESQVRANIETIHAPLIADPVYGQVPSFAAGERGIIDLLAVEATGRLAVMELKASEDIHLPLQALDYWMRVYWHLERNEFARQGYFPGLAITPEPPRLLLVAPALAFHPANETVLRYFSPAIPVERIGLAVKWEKEVRVMFRLAGAGAPEVPPCPWQTTLSRSGRQSST